MRAITRADAISYASNLDKLFQSQDTKASLDLATQNWNQYDPAPSINSIMVGIDSSYNTAEISTLPLNAADVVAIDKFGEVVFEEASVGLNFSDVESTILEVKAVIQTILSKKPDRIAVDGSAYSAASNPVLWEMYQPHMDKLLDGTVCFISKSSLSKLNFHGPLTDAFYFSKGTSKAGFSSPIVDRKYSNCKAITSSFIRLADNTPLLKLELVGEHTADEVKNVINDISQAPIGGYPYELVLAHQECLITKEDMNEIVSICGLSGNEISRQVLK